MLNVDDEPEKFSEFDSQPVEEIHSLIEDHHKRSSMIEAGRTQNTFLDPIWVWISLESLLTISRFGGATNSEMLRGEVRNRVERGTGVLQLGRFASSIL